MPILLIRLFIRGFKNPAYWHRWRERFGFITLADPVHIWVHAVSVGEARAAAPLVNRLLSNQGLRIIVTTMTPTGSEEVERLFGQKVIHRYAPYDYPGAIARFIKSTGPQVVMIMETEIWPNTIKYCSARGIPVLFANLRLSARSLQRYQRVKGMMKTVLSQVSCFAVQSPPDAQRLQILGAVPQTVHVTGSIKFEVRIPASLKEVAQVLRREWGQERPVWIAGSTHEGEDELVVDVYSELKKTHQDLVLVLVPRHPERFSTVTKLLRKTAFNIECRSDSRRGLTKTDIYVGDTMGELTLLYAAADIAFVGGSLVPHGGHNVLEPCALGVPVIFGPHMFNFLEISQLTRERGAGIEVRDKRELKTVVSKLLGDPNLRFKMGEAGKIFIEENKGALDRTLALFSEHIDHVQL